MTTKSRRIIATIAAAVCLGAVTACDTESLSTTSSSSSSITPSTNDEGVAVQPGTDVEPMEEDSDVPREFQNATRSAQTYSDIMHMSQQGIIDQLTSEYGDKYSMEAAEYAVDHIDVDYNENALAKAKTYQESMPMSDDGLLEQLTSEYGEKFTQEQAQYAIDHLDD